MPRNASPYAPRRTLRRLAGPILLASALLAGGCARSQPLRSIVLVTIDTLRADHLGTYGYVRDTSPNLDRLAARGVRFDHAASTIATTLPSHVALFTSRYPIQTGVLLNGKRFRVQKEEGGSPVRLFTEMVKDLGYTTAGFVGATPVKKYTGMAIGFDHWDQPDYKGRRAAVTTDRVLAWLESAPAEPFFLWVHYFDPHAPYRPPPAHQKAFTTDDSLLAFLRERGVPEPFAAKVLQANNLYDGEIHYTDAQLQRLIDALVASGRFDDLTLVVVGDHGEGMGQHGRIGHGEIQNEQLFVPLIMKFPAALGLEGVQVDRLVSLVDVVPTLIGTLALPVSEADRRQLTGIDALRRGGPRREYAVAQRTFGKPRRWGKGEKFSLVGLDWKYNYLTLDPDELFYTRTDPHELFNVLSVEGARGAELKEALLARLGELRNPEDEFLVEQETSPEVLRELRALGYIQ